ncbi:outer membrane lipoprotein LolB [Vibrio cholerae]|nr:outer membrane lipoprotein LolB [Vibrio cholerae]
MNKVRGSKLMMIKSTATKMHIASTEEWHVEYQRYQAIEWQHQPIPLPDKLKLQQNKTSIQLVISQWTLLP